MIKTIRINMKYLWILLILFFFTVPGCLDSSPYKETTPIELLEDPGAFEGKKVCMNGIVEIDAVTGNIEISDVVVGDLMDYPGINGNNTLIRVCGVYSDKKIEPDFIHQILSLSTDRNAYHSNETLKVHIDFNSTKEGRGQIQVAGIKNLFDRAMVSETREVSLRKGDNSFDFEFMTPSCEECDAVSPGEHYLNATVTLDGKSYEISRTIVLEKEPANGSPEQGGNISVEPTQIVQEETQKSVNKVNVEYFYDPACQKCEKAAPVIEAVSRSYGEQVEFLK
jgi:thiol-disulfide isomerase/thioredoxin